MGDQGSSSPWKWNPGPEFQDRGTSNACAQKEESQSGSHKAHEEIIDLCSGDAHSAGIKPNTFVRQVLAACLYPELQHGDTFPADVRQRAQCMLGGCHGGSVGSYSSPLGLRPVRHMVAEFITRRDGGVPSLPENIITCEGSEIGLMLVLRLLAKGEGISQTGVLIPVPSCSSVAMMMEKMGVVTVPYHLCEEEGWALQVDEVLRALQGSRGHCDPRVLYVINPCSSTGHLQSQKSIEETIRLAAKERLFLLVNEADQDSVHGEGSEFVSYKKVLFDMGPGFSDRVELISLYSVSKGFMGEGGLCGGYMELLNVNPAVIPKLEILLAVVASPPVPGQIALGAMADPPEPGDPSHATYVEEVRTIQRTLVRNVRQLQEMLDTLPGVSYQPPMGGRYVFPRLHLPTAALQHAKSLGVEADQLYCRKLLEEEGLCVGPGSEFGQKQGTHHIRLHVMVPPELLEDALGRLKRFHLRFFKAFS
ncbi:hypothetical protein GJAV_G00068860 [Gymnothorax javanicus]|nr:hypothetical protein GJAV_G00068860 [Gymnothorax javanicus]